MKILNDLQPTRDYLDIIYAMAEQCLIDTEHAPETPHWAVAIEKLAKRAIDELDKLHEVLRLENMERKNAGLHA